PALEDLPSHGRPRARRVRVRHRPPLQNGPLAGPLPCGATCLLLSARRRKTLLLLGALAVLWVSSSACQFGDGDCLRMSDCDTGYSCVEGTCRSNTPA